MPFKRRYLLTAAAASLLAGALPGCAQTPAPTEEFKPMVGQAGKDVIWVPTPDDVVQRMLDMVELRPGERVVDLGSGDGKIAIAAARRGARARGIEYNPDMVALSRRNARAAGVQVDFEQGDIFKADFRDADVVTLYLLPTLNERLRPILLDMKPGTRVTSHQFRMGDWEPDRTDQLAGRDAHLWIVPAKVGGTWTVRVGNEPPLQVELTQQFQKLEGHAVAGGNRTALARASLRGTAIQFEMPAATGALRFEGKVETNRILGTVISPPGQRRPFTATRG
jgi:SAM-dependent methyltransferase